MRPVYARDRASARVPHPAIAIPFLTVAVVAALSACGDSSTAPAATGNAPEAREARAFEVAGVTYPTVAVQNGNTTLAINGQEKLSAKLATPTNSWMGAYMTWTSSDETVASVSTSNQGDINGDIATVTGVASGTVTITGTTESGTSGSITITVGNGQQAPQSSPGGYHEPSGMNTQINTGPMTTPPSTNAYPANTWYEGSTKFTNYSPTTMSSTGEWIKNLSAADGGSGVRFNYGPSLVGGNSPVRMGTPISNAGSGDLYLRWNFRLSPNWTLSQATGLKLMEPRTVNSTENHVIDANPDGGSQSDMWPGVLLQFSTGNGTKGINVPGNPAGQLPNQSIFSSGVADVGGSARGSWHMIEMYFHHESPAGAKNGQLTLWVDGTQVYQSGGVNFFESGEAMGWNFLMFDPTYGGDKASDHPPTNIYWDIDDLYVSTR